MIPIIDIQKTRSLKNIQKPVELLEHSKIPGNPNESSSSSTGATEKSTLKKEPQDGIVLLVLLPLILILML